MAESISPFRKHFCILFRPTYSHYFIFFGPPGHPIIGDSKYGARQSFKLKDIALHSYSLTIIHPVTNIEVSIDLLLVLLFLLLLLIFLLIVPVCAYLFIDDIPAVIPHSNCDIVITDFVPRYRSGQHQNCVNVHTHKPYIQTHTHTHTHTRTDRHRQ